MSNQTAAIEVNFDGLVGPTHNYSGLSYGNVASTSNKQTPANPRKAALQGLKKMLFLRELGLGQGVLPPQERPYIPLLRQLGFQGKEAQIWIEAAKTSSALVNACSSAAAMWTANAATVSPSADSLDGKVHFTPANLSSNLHRSIETDTTALILKKVFRDERLFAHHPPLPSGTYFSDEGAANHTRLCSAYKAKGIQFFVWGKSSLNCHSFVQPTLYPARQTLEASQAIARNHQLDFEKVVFAQQNPHAIDQGVFHNDVIAVGNQHVLLYHEEAFVEQKKVVEELSNKFQKENKADPLLLAVQSNQIPLNEAIRTYLFNSQIVTLKDGSMAIIAPHECKKNVKTYEWLQNIVTVYPTVFSNVHYINLRESMRNGGGPACLRLRVVLTQKELNAVLPTVLLTDRLYAQLHAWVVKHYRDKLLPQDLIDPQLITETRTALDQLTQILQLGSIYEFQR